MGKLGHTALCVHSAEDALLAVHERTISLILLDLVLPKMSGEELCKTVRHFSDVPIVVISSISEPSSIVKLLELGADDYLTKPCPFAWVEAVVAAQLRRRDFNAGSRLWNEGTSITVGAVNLNLANQVAVFGSTEFHLTTRESQLVGCMLRRADQPITAEEIYEEVWGECNGQEKTVVSTTMQRLRTKIEKDPANPTFILNVRGYGYKLASRGAVLAEVARQA